MKVDFKGFSQLVSAMTVWNNFYDASKKFLSSSPIANTSVRRNEKIKIVLLENSLEMFNEL